MCYNDFKELATSKKCNVHIISSGDGWTQDKTSEGTIDFVDGCMKISYLLDGDWCVLTVDGDKVIQKRVGLQGVTITFEKAKTTVCNIQQDGFKGSFEIYTERLEIEKSSGGVKISLEYISGGEKIKLSFTAVKL